ncbi:transmembrane protein, putative [Medicago truncatula]|uniref:Transmembrane protein, putative n=1 Tax=Medicago truncatula TaxID=3880 RepID=G7JP25_MEDTR|nr:transmembrane protein, putative [Medicago truncatula]
MDQVVMYPHEIAVVAIAWFFAIAPIQLPGFSFLIVILQVLLVVPSILHSQPSIVQPQYKWDRRVYELTVLCVQKS